MPPPSPVQLLFSPEGRLARGPFLLLSAGLIGLLALIEYAPPMRVQRPLIAGPLKAVLFVAAACVLAKRLHDRGRSGWWWPAPLFAFLLAWPWLHGWVGWLACAGLAIAVVELGLRPGQRGFNRYGAPGHVLPSSSRP